MSDERRALLTEKQREALDLYELGFGYERIGRLLGLTKSGARDRVQKALRRIELALEDPDPVRKPDPARTRSTP